MIRAKIIADSVNPAGNRIVTWELTYPRFIHSEFMTHRAFSRNAASSRAIPIEKMTAAVRENPAMPEHWGRNQKGMQASECLDKTEEGAARLEWFNQALAAASNAEILSEIGLHKQIANRVLEPWMHMTVIATATEHANFFKLRAHPAAQPEFQVLAFSMLREYIRSLPAKVDWGCWHLPFHDWSEPITVNAIKICTARCAKVSYLKHDADATDDKLIELHNRLAASGHWSPFEHCARASLDYRDGNFRGWCQYRKYFDSECAVDVDYGNLMASCPDWVLDAMAKNRAPSP